MSMNWQENAYPPNLVHSLDSTHMMLTALHVSHKGLTFAAVSHSSFYILAEFVEMKLTDERIVGMMNYAYRCTIVSGRMQQMWM